MALADLYVDGILRPGALLSSVDEIRIYDAHRATLDEITAILGLDRQRRRLCGELEGVLAWLGEGLPTVLWRLWLRGDLASTTRPSPTTLDVVLLCAELPTNGFAWSLRILSCRPIQIDAAYTLDLKVLHGPDFRALDHDRERLRSSRRCLDTAGEQLVTGWLELLGGGEA